MKRLVFVIFVLSLAGCASIFRKDIPWECIVERKFDEVRVGDTDYIRVRGFISWSSYAVKGSRIERLSETEVWVHVTSGLATGDSGNFDVLVPVSDKTKTIYFGAGKTVIWARR